MKTFLKVIIVTVVLLIIAISFLGKFGIKNVHNVSETRVESIKNGFFQDDYVPMEKKLTLKLRSAIVILDSAWVEHTWTEKPTFWGSKLEMNGFSHNLLVKIDTVTTSDFIYSLDVIPDSIGGIWCYDPIRKRHEGKLHILPDTFRVQVLEKNLIDTIGWMQPIITDTVIFIKAKS